jgi:hypothetical protein
MQSGIIPVAMDWENLQDDMDMINALRQHKGDAIIQVRWEGVCVRCVRLEGNIEQPSSSTSSLFSLSKNKQDSNYVAYYAGTEVRRASVPSRVVCGGPLTVQGVPRLFPDTRNTHPTPLDQPHPTHELHRPSFTQTKNRQCDLVQAGERWGERFVAYTWSLKAPSSMIDSVDL